MDIVGAFVSQLKLNENSARGLAGQLLGLIEDTVREKVSFGVAARIRDAVPEMTQWQLSAPTMHPGSISLSDIEPPRLDQHAEMHGLLERFRVDVSESEAVNALALQFLSSRLEPSVIRSIANALRE
jgi:hypothetical protein